MLLYQAAWFLDCCIRRWSLFVHCIVCILQVFLRVLKCWCHCGSCCISLPRLLHPSFNHHMISLLHRSIVNSVLSLSLLIFAVGVAVSNRWPSLLRIHHPPPFIPTPHELPLPTTPQTTRKGGHQPPRQNEGLHVRLRRRSLAREDAHSWRRRNTELPQRSRKEHILLRIPPAFLLIIDK